jgi:hypothetical protein
MTVAETKQATSRLTSGKWQLNAIGITLLALLGASAWGIAAQTTPGPGKIIALVFVAYAAFRVVFELTFNRANVPTLATSYKARKKIAEFLQADAALRTAIPYSVIDLGSGRGELTRRIARKIPRAHVLGIETARIPFWQAKLLQRLVGPANVGYKSFDFWLYDCTTASAVTLFLNQRLAQKVGEKLGKELAPGSIVISYTFPLLGAWTPIETVSLRTPFRETIYIYRKA